jgi:16S rRNA (cytosine1407-C5)-methyltransferase
LKFFGVALQASIFNFDHEKTYFFMKPVYLTSEYCERLEEIVGAEHAESVFRSFEVEKTTSFRVNPLRGSVSETVEALISDGLSLQSIDWCQNAFYVTAAERDRLTHSPFAESGHVYVLGQSSIFATLVLDPKPDQWNLDLASAPGGKACNMAAMMENRGKLSVVEPIKPRMYRLAENLKRQGVSIAKTYLMDGRKVGRKVPDRFDNIMLDAPCSGDSRIRKEKPKTWEFWSERKVKEQSRKQKGLIESAFTALKHGGTLLYCTCSFSPEENEAIVDHLLTATEGAAKLQPIEMPFANWQPGLESFRDAEFDSSMSLTRRILPNENFDAFFMAKFSKGWPDDA